MLAALLLLSLGASSSPAVPVLSHEEPKPLPVRKLGGAADVLELCGNLVPAERLRLKGDAVERGAAKARQRAGRDEAIVARYEVVAPASSIFFAPYDEDERRLEVVEPATLKLPGGQATLTATMDRAIPVSIDAGIARRLVSAQKEGRLSLRLVFDLPDDATCASDKRGRKFVLGVEPVEWTWLEGEEALAFGGVAGDRPGVNASFGAKAVVEVGDPILGPMEAKKSVEGQRDALLRCYAEALKGDPSLDGVLVVEVGPKVSVAGDSTGSEELSRCVENALRALSQRERASVPVKFELLLPGTEPPSAAEKAD